MAYTFVPSRKHDKLADNGYLYRLDRENADGTTSWRCDQKVGQSSCKGRVKTDGVGGIEMITNHSCPLKPARVEVIITESAPSIGIQDVEATFDLLAAQYDADQDLAGLLDYFETTYIRGQRRRPARYPPEIWNCHQMTVDGLPRTNNNVEGWHRAFQGMVSCHHPSIYRLIENLQTEQSLMETRKARLDAGEQVPLYAKAAYRRVNLRLQTLTDDYANRDRIDFLRGCSYNFDF